MRIVPLSLPEANVFVGRHHRHHGVVRGHKFSVGLEDVEGRLLGVAVVGRPVSRVLDDGMTLEVNRLCTLGGKNHASRLYGACARACRELGYDRVVTYTLESELGVSLRASGWVEDGMTGGGSWSCAVRPREDKHPLCRKRRWVLELS